MQWRKAIVSMAILSLAMAFYDVLFQDYWYTYIESQGGNVGIGEVAGGYFLVGLFVLVLTYFVTRKMEGSS